MTLRLVARNIPWTVGLPELAEHFSQFGRIRKCAVLFDSKTGISRCIGFVSFRNNEDYGKALSEPNHIIEGQKIIVLPANGTPKAGSVVLEVDENA